MKIVVKNMFKLIFVIHFLSLGTIGDGFGLNIIHYNDFHARFVETSPNSGVCNAEIAPCIGGFARLTTAIREALEEEPQSLLLFGGDSFQGTIWYNIFRWKVTQEFMNLLPHDAHTMSSTGRLQFTDEVTAVKEEAEKLNAQGVDIIIVLSHCGIDIDKEIALNGGPYIDVIVGAHSHTLLFNGDAPENSGFEVAGSYPTVVERDEKPVLIVQAAAHTQYLGGIKVYFDDEGEVLAWEGNPRYLGNDVEQAPDIIEKINEYLPLIEEKSLEEIGWSLVYLSSSCRCGECNIGNLICDAYLHAVLDRAQCDNWNYAHFSIMNRGDIRAPIEAGVITFESVMTTTPFENNVEVYQLRGDHIREMLEYAVANTPFAGARMLQFSGLHVVYDGSRPVNERVLNVTIRCIECAVPRYEPLQLDKYYRMVSQDFVGQGGDGFTMISENRINVEVIGKDYDLILQYIRQVSPVYAEVEGRIQITDPCLV